MLDFFSSAKYAIFNWRLPTTFGKYLGWGLDISYYGTSEVMMKAKLISMHEYQGKEKECGEILIGRK